MFSVRKNRTNQICWCLISSFNPFLFQFELSYFRYSKSVIQMSLESFNFSIFFAHSKTRLKAYYSFSLFSDCIQRNLFRASESIPNQISWFNLMIVNVHSPFNSPRCWFRLDSDSISLQNLIQVRPSFTNSNLLPFLLMFWILPLHLSSF